MASHVQQRLSLAILVLSKKKQKKFIPMFNKKYKVVLCMHTHYTSINKVHHNIYDNYGNDDTVLKETYQSLDSCYSLPKSKIW